MKPKTFVMIALLTTAGACLAGEGGLEAAGKAAAGHAAKSAVPAAIPQGASTAGETLQKAKSLKDTATNTPATIQEHAIDTAKQKATEAVPAGAKQGAKAVEETAGQAGTLKDQAERAPQSVGEAKSALTGKAKQEAASKVLKTLH